MELATSGELRVVDPDGNEVPHVGCTIGEITVRGNVVMKGYYNDPEATAAIRDGWLHTGDAAVVHPNGYAEVRNRLKDVIISRGENISSIEVEALLFRHPAVQEVAVVGLPDEQWGKDPHAFVVLKTGATATEEELRQFARDNLAHFKAPKTVRFVPDLPRRRPARSRSTCRAEAGPPSPRTRAQERTGESAPRHSSESTEFTNGSRLKPTYT